MQEFRNLLKGWFGKSLLGIVILLFAFFGIEGIILNSGRSDFALSVNGVEISKAELDKAINGQREAMVQRMGGNVDPSFFTDEMLRPRVIESLIQKELLTQAVKDEGLYVASESVKTYVRNMPQFKDESGEFSQEKLETVLARAGYSPVRFYSELSSGMVAEQLQRGIGLSAFTTPDELKTLVQLDGQKRDVTYATLKLDGFNAGIELTDEDMATYFEANQAQYRTEEKVRIQYLAFKPSDFAKDIAVSDDEIQTEYDLYVKAQEGQERRRASHILVEVNDERSDADAKGRIEEAKSKLDAGEDFAALAQTYSDDIATSSAGGDLDYAGKGIYDPAFESALFGLKNEGDVSAIVKSEFGYHLIKLTGIEAQPVASLAEKKEELSKKIAEHKSADLLNEAIDQMNELTYAAGDLAAVSEKFGKPVEESAEFGRRGGAGITADPKIIEAAFSDNLLKEGMNSSAIELADGSVVVMRVSQHEPSRDRTLDEVRDQVVAALKLQKAREKAKQTAEEIVTKVREGAELESLTEQYDISWTNQPAVGRQSNEVSRTLVSKLFELPIPVEGGRSVDKVSLPSGDQEILVLTKVQEGEFALSEDEQLKAMLAAGNRFGQEEFEHYIASLREKAEIIQN